MDPITLNYLAKARIAELHQRADDYRLVREFRSATPPARPMRAALSQLLIRLGRRLAPAPYPSRIGHQLP
jgi:hypothetical protein